MIKLEIFILQNTLQIFDDNKIIEILQLIQGVGVQKLLNENFIRTKFYLGHFVTLYNNNNPLDLSSPFL